MPMCQTVHRSSSRLLASSWKRKSLWLAQVMIGNTCARWSVTPRACLRFPRALSLQRVSLAFVWPVFLFTMGKQMLMSAAVGCFRAVLLLLLVSCSPPLVRSSEALYNLSALTYPYSSILSPLLKALSEQGGSRWSPGLRKRGKPEHNYVKYLTEVYRKSTRMKRSVDGEKVYNTIRLLKPQDECPAQSNKGEQSWFNICSCQFRNIGLQWFKLKNGKSCNKNEKNVVSLAPIGWLKDWLLCFFTLIFAHFSQESFPPTPKLLPCIQNLVTYFCFHLEMQQHWFLKLEFWLGKLKVNIKYGCWVYNML